MNNINDIPLQTTSNLLNAFPSNLQKRDPWPRKVPVGIEVEVPWRGYFPDLWVDGFPNVDEETLARITEECTKREETLIPKLRKTQECGVKRGADKYWEFAFDPVTDVRITCDHVEILRQHNLIPEGPHSLHITFGGLRATRDMHYVAMILECFACSPERILSGFHPTSEAQSVGWARKGFAGLFEKTGSHDLLHGYQYGCEIRLLTLPQTDDELFYLLDIGQCFAVLALNKDPMWTRIRDTLKMILLKNGLPDENWKKPHINPELWKDVAEKWPAVQAKVVDFISDVYP